MKDFSRTKPGGLCLWNYGLVLVGALLAPPLVPAERIHADALVADYSPGMTEPEAIFESMERISELDLAEMRGGINLGGLDMSFAVNLSTIVDGATVLEASLTVTQAGTVSSQVQATALLGVTPFGPGTDTTVAEVTPSSVDLSGLAKDATGVAISDDKGFTSVIQQINDQQIISVVNNQAMDRDIDSRINVDVTIANFSQFQGLVRNTLLVNGLLGGSLP